jgi:hypothetical protein
MQEITILWWSSLNIFDMLFITTMLTLVYIRDKNPIERVFLVVNLFDWLQ